jgi:N-formylglutamate amidohydrolase
VIKDFKKYELLSDVLVIIPHSGTICPEEIPIEDLSKYQNKLADECIDWHTNSLYDFRYIMNNKQIVNPISNVYVNVNRHPDQIEESVPLKYEDIPIYEKDPSMKTRKLMIEKYHDPFHKEIRK